MAERREPIRALATITLDAGVLEQLGPQAIDRLAELVEARILGRRRGGEGRLASGLLSVAAVAEDAGVSPSLVYREIERGQLAALRVGGRLRIEPEAVATWKERSRVRPRIEPPAYEPPMRGRRASPSGSFADALDAIEREAGAA
jgi:excisionase family DNA binding protein